MMCGKESGKWLAGYWDKYQQLVLSGAGCSLWTISLGRHGLQNGRHFHFPPENTAQAAASIGLSILRTARTHFSFMQCSYIYLCEERKSAHTSIYTHGSYIDGHRYSPRGVAMPTCWLSSHPSTANPNHFKDEDVKCCFWREKPDRSYGLFRKWPSLPPIRTSRHSSTTWFQCLLLFQVHTLKFKKPASAKRKGSTSIAADSLLLLSVQCKRKNKLFKTGCPIVF